MRPTDLDRSEIMMYMGTAQLDSSLSQMLNKCVCELCQTAQPRTVCGLFDVEHTPKGVTVGGLPLEGKDIALHLEGCKKAVIMAATLSASVDTLIRRAQYVDMTKALMYDAAAGAAIEFVCGEFEKEIKLAYPSPFYTERFSPGYGDLPITHQKDILNLLDAARKIGLTVTDAHTLLPLKSVSALIGLSDHPVNDARRFGCAKSCTDCPYNKTCKMRKP